ncbi:MAG: hypothetical protein JNM96_04745 [Bacteroidia bacterium]|nr:hypothetical protein [Bacteroidia bacterium]
MRINLLTVFCFLFISLSAQRLSNYIVLANKDSIICSSIEHGCSSNGRLNYLKYTTLDGKLVEYKNRFKIPKLDCFRYKRQTYEMIPRRSYKQKKRNIVGKRLADGAMTYCFYNNEHFVTATRFNSGSGRMETSTGKSGFKLRYVRMQDGYYLKLNKRTMRRKIKPILKSCEQFVKEYSGNYKIKMFGNGLPEMFQLYNRLCSKDISK